MKTIVSCLTVLVQHSFVTLLPVVKGGLDVWGQERGGRYGNHLAKILAPNFNSGQRHRTN